ncbi:MAG: SDR family oxidoreductase [SAR324 cluster bacterium]|nr:SDR family oxidoreductase [SAR324 cluster bacterium]
MDYGLKSKVALICGGASGIGLEAGVVLAAEGASVVCADIDAETMSRNAGKVRESGLEIAEISTDFTDPASVQKMADQAMARFGQVDILVYSAGIVSDKLFIESTHEDWKKEIDVSLIGPMLCTKALLPQMMERNCGRIIILSSDSARVGQARLSYYAAAKAGAAAFAKSLAQEVGRYGITVNVVSPSATNTPVRQAREEEICLQIGDEAYTERVRKVLRNYPLGRLGEPSDIAAAIAFLASERAAWITGQVLSVNGGYVMP